jgi:hypothetical protein
MEHPLSPGRMAAGASGRSRDELYETKGSRDIAFSYQGEVRIGSRAAVPTSSVHGRCTFNCGRARDCRHRRSGLQPEIAVPFRGTGNWCSLIR